MPKELKGSVPPQEGRSERGAEKLCKHAIPGTSTPGYRGFEICPYCGKHALMGTQFRATTEEEERKKPPTIEEALEELKKKKN